MKPGYKQTKVGVIPVDWDVRLLSEHFRIYAGGDVPKHSLSDIRSELHPYPIFANSLQENGLYGFTGERRAKGGSLTITGRGYLGHAVYRDEDFFPIVRLLVLEPISQLDASFTTFAVNERVKFAFESTGVPQLTAPQVGRYSVAAPPLPEQRAIATALSDVDALIAALDRLIAKQRDLKQAAMQQLLTGQTRLPGFTGFTGKWGTKRLGDVASLSKGSQLHSSQMDDAGNFAHLNGGITPSGYTHKSNTAANTIAISEGGNSCGFVQFMTEPYWCGGHCYSVIPNGIDNRYLYHALKGQQSGIMALRVGSGLPNVQKTALLAFSLPVPADLPEQTAIATVLSDMDAELTALEQRREKTRALKQGMMQELLTGRTRLV